MHDLTGLSATEISALISAVAAAVLVFITFANLKIFKQTFEARFEPYVIVTLALDHESSAQVIMLVIQNIGTGLAQDVTFEISRPIPLWAGGINPDSANISGPMEDGPLINGILSLGPGEARSLHWGQYGGLLKALGPEPISILCRFKREGKAMPPIRCFLDIASFKGIAAPKSALVNLAGTTQKFTRSFDKMQNDVRAIRNHLQTTKHS